MVKDFGGLLGISDNMVFDLCSTPVVEGGLGILP